MAELETKRFEAASGEDFEAASGEDFEAASRKERLNSQLRKVLIEPVYVLITQLNSNVLPSVGTQNQNRRWSIIELPEYISSVRGTGVFLDRELNLRALEYLNEIEPIVEAWSQLSLSRFESDVELLIVQQQQARPVRVTLPNFYGDSSRKWKFDELPEYISTVRKPGVFPLYNRELNLRALEYLSSIEALFPSSEFKNKQDVGTLLVKIFNSLITKQKDSVALPAVATGSIERLRMFYTVDELPEYIRTVQANKVFSDPVQNDEALQYLAQYRELLDLEDRVPPDIRQLVEQTSDLKELGKKLQDRVRVQSDIEEREVALAYARTRRRFFTKSRLISLITEQTTPTIEQIRAEIAQLETTDQADRDAINEVSIAYGVRLVDGYRVSAATRLGNYSPGLRRVLIEEAQALLGTGFVRNGAEKTLGQILQATVDFQRRYFQKKLNTLSTTNALTGESIESLISQFETFNVDDLTYTASLREVSFSRLRGFNLSRVRLQFDKQPANKVIDDIQALPEEYRQDVEVKEKLLNEYKDFLRARKAERFLDYDFVFKDEIQLIRKEGAKDYELRDVGRNSEGARLVSQNFRQRLLPLLQVFEGDKQAVARITATLSPESRRKFVLDIGQLKSQRDLTAIEEAWFRSSELTSFTIPYLVSLEKADREVLLQHLEYIFAKLSAETQERLDAPQYFPAVVIGLGPNGIAAIGEIRRLQPELLKGTLVVDQARNPGGPFAVPESASFNLNSQAPRLANRPQLPDRPTYDETRSIQGYVSPLQALPGQRTEDEKVVRGLSINQTDPALIADKDISGEIYPTNEDLELVVKLQSAVSVNHLALSTRLVSVEKNTTRLPGSKLVTLEITEADGTKRLTQVTTDLLINSTGLGEPSYGFDVKGKRAERVVTASEEQTESVPKVSVTLDAFRGLGGRFEENVGSGLRRVVGIVGKGNSFDTLAEKIVGRFVPAKASEQAKMIRDQIGKIYVIADRPPRNAREYFLSQRSRYANLADFIDRDDGKDENERLITFVNARVGDFDFTPETGTLPVPERKVNLFDQNNRQVQDQYGKVIEFDNVFFTTGFRPIQDEVYGEYARQNGEARFNKSPLTLSSAPKIQVGEQLPYDPDTIFIGTGSEFASNPKLRDSKLLDIATVSPEAADALLRVGAKNLVAVGVKSRDAVAAVNDYIWSRRDRIAGFIEQYNAQLEQQQNAPRKPRKLANERSVRLSNQLSVEQRQFFAASVIATELEGTVLREGNNLIDRDYVFELSLGSERTQPVQPEETVSISRTLVGVFANQIDPSSKPLPTNERITRATKVITTHHLPISDVPEELLTVLDSPFFAKTLKSILPLSDTGKYKVRISFRKGRVLPQRTKLIPVAGF